MNSWAKALGLVILPALFFSGCEKEDLEIGLPPKTNIFDIRYFEYNPPSSVFLRDIIPSNGKDRLLVGQYTDSELGNVYAESYGQLVPSSQDIEYINSSDVLDSVVLILYNDYVYGENISSYQSVRIAAFEGYDSSNLITSTKMATLADLGVAQFNVKPVGNGPYGDTVRVRLDNSYMSTVFDSLKNFNLDFGRGFINSFQGIALIPEAGNDAVLGINAKSTGSMLSFYYSTPGDTENSSIDIPFGSGRHSYITPNHLENFRAGTVLDGLAEFYTNFDPGNDRVYFQSGTGVRVNLDMSSLISIGDTLQNIMVNSAILEISNLENTSPTLFPSGSIELFLSDETNEWLSFANVRRKIYGRNRSDSTSLMRQNPNTLTAERLLYFKKENALKADITMYVQNVMENKSDLLNIILEDEQAGGNISRFSTRKSDIKVKVYYTVKK